MQPIEGIHHISLITGDAPRNVDFYARVLGLRMVKKTVNQDDPGVYHLFYADEHGSPGADITFFEYPDAQPGRAGAGMLSRIAHRVAGDDALDYWADRLGVEGIVTERATGRLRFADPEGMGHELVVSQVPDAPLIAAHREVPPRFALQGFDSVHALVRDPEHSEALLAQTLGFASVAPHDWEARGERRGGRIVFEGSDVRAIPGAGTVHHIAWSVLASELADWRQQVANAGARPTPVIDRFWFESVYFREPGGILYELATLDGAGFAADEAPEQLGRTLVLPPLLESQRSQIEPALTPLPDTSPWRPEPTPARG
ncbi:MAG: VOC family protein [Solirubrobacteraceae bacterium]